MILKPLTYIAILFILAAEANDLKCFAKIDSTAPIHLLNNDSIQVTGGIILDTILNNEFIKDSLKIYYRIMIDHLDGNLFWNTLTKSYVSKIEIWTCDIPYFQSTCHSGLGISINFGSTKLKAKARIEELDLKNKYFILQLNDDYYRYVINDNGIKHLRVFFKALIANIPDEIQNGCK
jgi:hypothetical protein